MSAVVRGSRIRIMTAAKRLGLYSALRAWRAIFFKSSLQPKLTVDTIFLQRIQIRRILTKGSLKLVFVVVELSFLTVAVG